MSTCFGSLDVRLDPWPTDYGSETPGLGESAEEAPTVTLDVETAAWQPIVPAAPSAAPRLVFVDGVRRLEARIVVREGTRRALGAFGSHAVGAVAVENGQARFTSSEVDRVVACGGGLTLPGPVAVGPALVYRPVSAAGDDAEAPLRAVQAQMRLAEERLSGRLADEPGTVVIGDGPLSFEHPSRGAAVGYVKRLVDLHLPDSHRGILASLPTGARTPLFTLAGTRRFARHAWFLRLAAPRRGDAETSGLVRLEVSEQVGVATARALADLTAALLPAFATVRGLHARAPQNLLPIAALETRLRRELGDAGVIGRLVQSLVATEAA
jgi:hypothetical protein